MKKFFKFIFGFMKLIAEGVFKTFRIPLVIAGIALFSGIFNKQMVFCIFCLDFGMVIMAMPAVFTGKILIENVIVLRRGEKFSGTCMGYKFEHWNCGYDVYWSDNNKKFNSRFDVPMVRFRYPCSVNVYKLNHAINLGIFTIIKNVTCFVICVLLWVVCTGITLHAICNIFVYG